MQNDELADREIEQIRMSLDQTPSPELENRVIESLRTRGLLRRGPIGRNRWTFAIAAIVVTAAFFVVGMVVGRNVERDAASVTGLESDGEAYLLLLRESEGSAPRSEAETAKLVEEYSRWAREQADSGVLIAGEKLHRGGVVLESLRETTRPWTREEGFVGGYFLIRAASYDDAAAIARTCPHLDHGGVIEVRRIDRTS